MPPFWYAKDRKRNPLLSSVLWPASKLYTIGAMVNRATTREKKSPIPVICIGNITIGGAGKTPTARAIMQMVQEHGKFATPCFLMRGYGGSEKGPLEVNPTQHTSFAVGDEALMQAQYAPTIIARDRYAGAKLAQESGYDLIIMDDGFQNPRLKKDLSLLVVDGTFGFGNGRVFPAGPLREPVSSALRRAQGVIIINRHADTDLSAINKAKQFDAHIDLINKGAKTEDKKVIAFAGIAMPEKFFNTLEQNGYYLFAHHAFPDHHVYRHGDLEKIVSAATTKNLSVITTEKDWIRLSDKWKSQISYLKIAVVLDDKFKRTLFKFLDKLAASS